MLVPGGVKLIGFIKKLYEVDHTIAKLPPSGRTEERRLAVSSLETFKAWLDRQDLVALPQSPIAEAIG